MFLFRRGGAEHPAEPQRQQPEQREVGVQAAQEAALLLSGAAAVQAEAEFRGFRLQSSAAAAARSGPEEREGAQPGETGQQRLRHSAGARPQRRRQQEDEQSGDAALSRGVHPRPAAATGRTRRGERGVSVRRPVAHHVAGILR